MIPLLKIIDVQCTIMHCTCTVRQTVQMLLSITDPEGVARRKGRRLKRRIYQNKVCYEM